MDIGIISPFFADAVSSASVGGLKFDALDVTVFLVFIVAVVAVGLIKSRGEKGSEDYFLAGRGLTWWLIGISLIAANISTEQFVGMSGSAAGITGLAIASFEWLAAVTLVLVAFLFLPKFLKSGIYTIPQFLEYRYDTTTRTIVSLIMVIVLVCVNISAVIYSGALMADTVFLEVTWLNLPAYCWIIGIIAAIYVCAGGLKACAWADLLQGTALILGGAIIAYFAFRVFGGMDVMDIASTANVTPEQLKSLADASVAEKFFTLNSNKLTMFMPSDHLEVPWTALVLGLWIPNLYYWGFNQYIIQRTLGAKSLAEGQKGIMFAAGLKLIIPFIIVLPGILAFNIYANDLRLEAQRDTKILESNAKTYAPIYFHQMETAGKVPSHEAAMEYFSAEINGKKQNIIGKDVAEELLGAYYSMKKSGAIKDYAVKADDGWRESNPELAKTVDLWNATVAKDAKSTAKVLNGYKYDAALAMLIRNVLPDSFGLRGFIFAALLGAVVSSLASMLNAASTIFTIDIFKKFIRPSASNSSQVFMGRLTVLIFTAIGCLVAPQLANPKLGTIFVFIQEFQGFISPGVLAIFIFGMFSKRTPRFSGVIGILTSSIVYGILYFSFSDIAYLNRMAIALFFSLAVMFLLTVLKPLKSDVVMPVNESMSLESSSGAKIAGVSILAITAALYITFSGLFF